MRWKWPGKTVPMFCDVKKGKMLSLLLVDIKGSRAKIMGIVLTTTAL